MAKFAPSTPVTASIGQACYECFKTVGEGTTLRRCAKCRTIQYCSTACQKANWKIHKEMCNALHRMNSDKDFGNHLASSLVKEPPANLSDLGPITDSIVQNEIEYITRDINGHLTIDEISLLKWEPRCMACGRTERLMRFEAAEKKTIPRLLAACPDCKMAFYCSKDHWDVVKHIHYNEPCEGSHDSSVTQCQINQEINQDTSLFTFDKVEADNAVTVHEQDEEETGLGPFQWTPRPLRNDWVSLKNTDWDAEYASSDDSEVYNSTARGKSLLRAATEGLSIPMTILWALETLHEDDAWTRKSTLTIHIIEACDIEFIYADAFEEVLHRLPEVKTLNIVLCGQALSEVTESKDRGRDIDVEVCSDCTTANRQRINQMFAQTYHDFARIQRNFVKPDLVVCFNTAGSSTNSDTQDRKKTIDFLVKNKIPTVFTAINRKIAEGVGDLLKQAGAKLNPALGPAKNPWGSRVKKPEPYQVTGFYAMNNWLAGGFS